MQDFAYLTAGVLQDRIQIFHICVCIFAELTGTNFTDLVRGTIPLWKQNNALISMWCIMYCCHFFWKLSDAPRMNGNKCRRRCVSLPVVQGLSVLPLLFSVCLSFLLLLPYCALGLFNVRELSHGACQNPS